MRIQTPSTPTGKSLLEEIDQNRHRTVAFMISAMVLMLGILLLPEFFVIFDKEATPDVVDSALQVMLYFVIGVAIYLVFNYFHAAKRLMKINHAEPLDSDMMANSEFGRMITELAYAANIPVPKVFVIDDPSMNAFATGRNPEHGQVAFTITLLETMPMEQVRAVAAHEMAHIRNHDVQLSTVAVGMTSVISGFGLALIRLGSVMSRFGFWWNRRRDSGTTLKLGGALSGLVVSLAGFIVMVVGVPLMRLSERGMSRQRESLADVTAAEITRDPQAMINALKTLEGDVVPPRYLNMATSSMFINAPHLQRGWFKRLWATHPPLDARIKRLEQLLN